MDYEDEKKDFPSVTAIARMSSEDSADQASWESFDAHLNPIAQKQAQCSRDVKAKIERIGGITKFSQFDDVAYAPDYESGDINYHSLEWWQAGLLMIAETISLGILSLPAVFATVGIVGASFLVLGLGLISTYTGYTIGLFKIVYPHVENMADAGRVMFGRPGGIFLGIAQIVFLIFICGSHVLTGLIALDKISRTGTCVVGWSIITAGASFVLCLPRTFQKLSYFSIASFTSIIIAVLVTMIGVAIHGTTEHVAVVVDTSFNKGFLAATNVVFAYAGHAAFFNFMSEMKKPRDYPKALYMLQIADISLYYIIGVVVYYFVGHGVKSPAIGSTGVTLERVAYGIAIPTIIIAGVINGSVAAKLIMRSIFVKNGKASRHYTNNTTKGWIVWILIVAGIWFAAFLIAEVVPFFDNLLGIIASLFAAVFTFSIAGYFWLYINPRKTWFATKTRALLTIFNMFIIVMGFTIMIAGLYASISQIADGYSSGKWGKPFACSRPLQD